MKMGCLLFNKKIGVNEAINGHTTLFVLGICSSLFLKGKGGRKDAVPYSPDSLPLGSFFPGAFLQSDEKGWYPFQ